MTEASSYLLFRPPLLLFRITYHYQALLLCKWSLAPIIKLSPHGNRCNFLEARDLWVSNDGENVKGENDSSKVLAKEKTIKVSVWNVLSPFLYMLTQ
jgi:hypothetical protein